MNEHNIEISIRKFSTFITATSLLVVVLLVWAQLWIQPSIQLWSKWYEPELGITRYLSDFSPFNYSVGFGLSWIYFAVFLALFALAWAGWKTLATHENKTPDTAIGLFAASLVMGVMGVSQSVFTATLKFCKGKPIYESFKFEWLELFLLVAIVIVGLSIWGAHTLDKYKGRWEYLPGKLEVIIIVVAAGVVLYLNEQTVVGILGQPYCLLILWIIFVIGTLGLITWFFVKRGKRE